MNKENDILDFIHEWINNSDNRTDEKRFICETINLFLERISLSFHFIYDIHEHVSSKGNRNVRQKPPSTLYT